MKKEYCFYVYIMSNYKRTVFYTGLTNNIVRRTIEHQSGYGSEFTRKYKLAYLIYFEEYQYIGDAINREKEIKGWLRKKKVNLIKSTNSNLIDLSEDLFKDFGIKKEDIDEIKKELDPSLKLRMTK